MAIMHRIRVNTEVYRVYAIKVMISDADVIKSFTAMTKSFPTDMQDICSDAPRVFLLLCDAKKHPQPMYAILAYVSIL